MSKRLGKNCSVKIGGNKIAGMGQMNINGVSVDQIEVTAMGDSWKSFMFGLKDGGEVTFSGFFDPDDSTGQNLVRLGNVLSSSLTDINFFIDNTSFYNPCQTTGYWDPSNTSNMPTQMSYATITKWDVKFDKSGVGTCDFTAKISGCLVLQ